MRRTAVRVVSLLVPLFAASSVFAEATATIEKTHLCCNSCVKGVQKAVSSVDGAKVKCDREAQTITVTAPDADTAQKAVDAILAAGYYGKASGAALKDDSGAKAGKSQSVVVSGFHNCCKKCTTALNETIKKVPGATGEVDAKATTVTVTGDFDPAALVQAFNDAGFHAKIESK
ncbi:MAG TPA: cation transporter [Tepidisphaeraceae bacterium]|jgi:copper chaperone CopZ|nr:cation transporter [Tepidisphaeraceae bacterium]